MVVKTYRGLLADGAQERIPLSTKDGSVGYRVIKFELLPYNPASQSSENTIAIWKTGSAASAANKYINFTDSDLVAAGYIQNGASNAEAMTVTIIFDDEIFNQDIYVTNQVGDVASQGINYYIELEQMKLDHTQNMSATLKAIRGSAVD